MFLGASASLGYVFKRNMNMYPTICFEGHVFVVHVSLCYVSKTNVSRRISSDVFWEI